MQIAAQTGRCTHLPSPSFQSRVPASLQRCSLARRHNASKRLPHTVRAEQRNVEQKMAEAGDRADPKQTTEKYGLEAGLWQIFTSKDPVTGKTKGDQAKDLLKKYGSAYLITSISFAIVSFAACYALVNAGVDMGGLLARIGITVNATNEKVGTVAIAYAAHKALSPIRFPPTVALTPVVARLLGRNEADAADVTKNGPTP